MLAARFRLLALWCSQVCRNLADNCLRMFVVLLVAQAGALATAASWHRVTLFYLLPFILLAPVFIEPLLNKYTPMQPGPLRSEILRIAHEQGIPTNDRRALLAKPAVQKKMEQEVLGGLGDLSEVEMPKKLGLLANPFSIENNTLTLTDKVRRRAVQEIYAPLIDRFYDPANEHRTVFAG